MNLSNITPMKIIAQKIVVDQPTIFMVFPDTNVKVWEEIYKTNFLLANCEGIICPPKMFTFMRKKFNGKVQALNFKKEMTLMKITSKKLKILTNIHEKSKIDESANVKSKKNYYFYDLSVYSNVINTIKEKYTTKQILIEMLTQIQKTYQSLKDNFPTYNVQMLFLMKDDMGYLMDIFKHIRMNISKDKLDEFTFFDDFVFISTDNKYLIPIMNRDKGKNVFILQHLTNLDGYFVKDETENKEIIFNDKDAKSEEIASSANNIQKDSIPDINGSGENNTPTEVLNPAKNMASDLAVQPVKTNAKIDENGNVNVEINTKQLKKLLKTHNIDDPAILSNVKVAIDKYLSDNQQKQKINKDEAETLILKAINKTVHGTDTLKEEYLHSPALLFNKLKDTKTYQVPLDFPEYDNELIQPRDIIDLDYTCGQYRQKFEFTETVHKNVEKLFKTLENTTNFPIKILKIDHEVIDNNKDRLIRYKILVKNMGGGFPKPYELTLNIPGLVSERYFKLKDSHYIMKTQQFLKPLTKTDPNEVRLLSSYAIVRISLKNFKFSSANIGEILNYIRIKYPDMIKEETDEYIKFLDNDVIGVSGNLVFENHEGTQKIIIDPDTNVLMDNNNEKINGSKYEYQLDVIFDKIKMMNPTETLSKSKLKIPYLEIYLGGVKIPLILYLWSQKGLLISLNDESIKYSLDAEEDNKASYSLKIKDQVLNIYPETFRQKCLVNGLVALSLKESIEADVNNPESSYDIITNYTHSSGAIRLISLLTENELDPITKDLLEFEGLSTNFVKLVSKDAVDKLFNQMPDNLSDLSIYRTRLSEMIFATMYKQLMMAKNSYRNKVFNFEDPEAKIEVFEDFITQNLITTSGVLQNTEPFNPLDEIMLSSRVIKTGRGGVPSRHSFKLEHRSIHPSSYGNLGANSTSESADVGLVNHHTLTPSILNQYGSYGVKDINGLKPWETLSLDEAMTPFQNSCDADRLMMARQHQTQTVPVENAEVPILMTGGESIIGQISSTRFIHRAKMAGRVIDVLPEKYITVRYTDGTIENLDIIPRKSRTKRGSFIQLEMDTLQKDQPFKKNDTLAWTKNFKQGIYAPGKNVTVCFMNYRGYCHEDSYTITQDLAEKIKRTIIKPIDIVIPPNTKILYIEEGKKHVDINDVLLEFVTNMNLEDYMKTQDIDLEDENIEQALLSQSSKSMKLLASFSGEIVGMKIFLNTKRDMDQKLLNLHKQLVDQDKAVIEVLKKGKNEDDAMSSLDNIDTSFFEIGGHTLKGGKEFLGANIVFYIREQHTMSSGDKMTNRFGSKGVVSHLIDTNAEPYAEETQLKPEVFISPISIFSRKNIPFLKEIYIGKIFHFLEIQCQEMANKDKIPTDRILKKIVGVYQLLASKNVHEQIEDRLNKMSSSTLRKQLKEKTLNLRLIIEPFENIEMSKIKQAADFINIPLDEKVFIPELGAFTDVPVPVGIGYYLFMEQISEDYGNIRGADVYTGLTRQPTKGKLRSGGQSVSGQDIYALLSLDADDCLNELLTARSDDHVAKRKLYLEILSNGELASMPKDSGGGGTTNLFNLYMRGMGLEIS